MKLDAQKIVGALALLLLAMLAYYLREQVQRLDKIEDRLHAVELDQRTIAAGLDIALEPGAE